MQSVEFKRRVFLALFLVFGDEIFKRKKKKKRVKYNLGLCINSQISVINGKK